MKWVPHVREEHARVELVPRFFWLKHVIPSLATAGVLSLPAVSRWTHVGAASMMGAVAVHLVMYGVTVYTYRPGRWGTFLYALAPVTNIGVVAFVVGSTGQPATPLWGFYILYAVVAAQARARPYRRGEPVPFHPR